MQAKFDKKGKPFAGEDFDRILWNYDAVSDEPCCHFVDELLAAYPDSKVILNVRTRESWLRSMQNSVLTVLSWRSFTILSYLDQDFSAGYWPLLNYSTSVLSRGIPAYKAAAAPALLESFDRHYDYVRKVVPKRKLLEFHPSQGWKPLCQFLDLPIPEEEFPNLNEPSSLLQIRKRMYWSRWYHVMQEFLKATCIVGVALAAIRMAYIELRG
ncbi:uncharacterized protein GIQ15_05777 [Arthroderma uncinatum]|uniref:uncharacterized protein n=1 Tax=Arthroderma uncinatum TaxID=74035 RepID=UPI00144A622A|nr:uncharacterized protein GIQ15_05777 [Arthroderma uncinatum]KAF3480430.1 hypothetical protein GIQ15_05777 [Arthroderma uncinatum]